MTTILPGSEEVPYLVAQPGSALWRYAGDARLIGAGTYALLLQVAHPTVGAGVSEHSNFRADPWGRLLRTLDYVYAITYGGPDLAAEMGRRIRAMHVPISGVKPDGERYHALEPSAFAWVHATLADSIVRSNQLLVRRIPAIEIEGFYAEWRRAGRLIGVRDRDLPESWLEFREYFDRTVEEKLERTAAVDEVLDTLAEPRRPELPSPLSEAAWRIVRIPIARQLSLMTAGLLSPLLRKRFGIGWTPFRERRLRVLAAASRSTTPLLPRTLRNVGPSYLRWRQEAIARGADPAAQLPPLA